MNTECHRDLKAQTPAKVQISNTIAYSSNCGVTDSSSSTMGRTKGQNRKKAIQWLTRTLDHVPTEAEIKAVLCRKPWKQIGGLRVVRAPSGGSRRVKQTAGKSTGDHAPKKVEVKGPSVKASNGHRYSKAYILNLPQHECDQLGLGTAQQIRNAEVEAKREMEEMDAQQHGCSA
jgi:hypothetical protein